MSVGYFWPILFFFVFTWLGFTTVMATLMLAAYGVSNYLVANVSYFWYFFLNSMAALKKVFSQFQLHLRYNCLFTSFSQI